MMVLMNNYCKSSVFSWIVKLKCLLNFLVYISLELKGLPKSMTYQFVSTKTKDSVSYVIIEINQRLRDEYEQKIYQSCQEVLQEKVTPPPYIVLDYWEGWNSLLRS